MPAWSRIDGGISVYTHKLGPTYTERFLTASSPDILETFCYYSDYTSDEPRYQFRCYKDDSFQKYSVNNCKDIAGLNEQNNYGNTVSIFANPARNELKILGNNSINNLSISKAIGQKVCLLNQPGNLSTIDIAFLPKGLYYVSVGNESGAKVFKLVNE